MARRELQKQHLAHRDKVSPFSIGEMKAATSLRCSDVAWSKKCAVAWKRPTTSCPEKDRLEFADKPFGQWAMKTKSEEVCSAWLLVPRVDVQLCRGSDSRKLYSLPCRTGWFAAVSVDGTECSVFRTLLEPTRAMLGEWLEPALNADVTSVLVQYCDDPEAAPQYFDIYCGTTPVFQAGTSSFCWSPEYKAAFKDTLDWAALEKRLWDAWTVSLVHSPTGDTRQLRTLYSIDVSWCDLPLSAGPLLHKSTEIKQCRMAKIHKVYYVTTASASIGVPAPGANEPKVTIRTIVWNNQELNMLHGSQVIVETRQPGPWYLRWSSQGGGRSGLDVLVTMDSSEGLVVACQEPLIVGEKSSLPEQITTLTRGDI